MIANLLMSALVAFPAVPQTEPQTPIQTQAAAPPVAAPKQSCRRETSTGSIMPGKKTCHTAAEWKAIDRANQNSIDNYHDRASTRGGVDN